MNIIIEKFIPACDRLYTFSANKRFELLSNQFEAEDEIGKYAIEINRSIASEFGLDIFQISEKNEIVAFEEILTDKVSQFSFDNFFSPEEIEDEEELIKDTFEVSNDILLNKEYIDLETGVEEFRKLFRINRNELKHIVQHPTKIVVLKKSGKRINESAFITAVSTVANKKRILLFQVMFVNKIIESGKIRPTISKSGIMLPEGKRTIHLKPSETHFAVSIMLAFNYEDYKEYVNYPLRLFFKALDMYGVYLKILNQEKIYYRRVSLPDKFNLEPMSIIKYNESASDVLGPSFSSDTMGDSFYIENVFAINRKKYFEDFRSLNI